MSHSIGKGLQSFSWNRPTPVPGVILCLALFAASPAGAGVVAQYDFEDGTAQGWVSFNGASNPVNSTAAAYTGTHSLLTTTAAGGAGGPSILVSLILLPGATYSITGYLMLTSGESFTNADFTMMRSDPSCSGGTCFDTIGSYQVPVTASGWAQIGGTYTVSDTELGLRLYAQLVGPSTAESFYLDNVVITDTAPPPSGTPEPTSLLMISTALMPFAFAGWRRRKAWNRSPQVGVGVGEAAVDKAGGPFALEITPPAKRRSRHLEHNWPQRFGLNADADK